MSRVSSASIGMAYQAVLFGIVVWDWIVCAQSEYRNIWKATCSLPKYLYIITRYLCLGTTAAVFSLCFVNRTLAQCNALIRANCAALLVIQMASMAVLTQRAYMLSQRNKWVLAVLLPLMCTTLVLGITHAVFAIEADSGEVADGSCSVITPPHFTTLSAAFFAVPILSNTIATAIVVQKAIHLLPHNKGLRNLLLVDGLLFLIGVDTVGLVQLTFYLGGMGNALKMLNSAALLSLTSVFCCRFILHLREASEKGTESADTRLAQVDWTQSFGRPEKPMKEPFWRRASARYPSAYAGSTTVCSSNPESWLSRPEPAQMGFITVSHIVQHEVDEMTESEKCWEQQHPVDGFSAMKAAI